MSQNKLKKFISLEKHSHFQQNDSPYWLRDRHDERTAQIHLQQRPKLLLLIVAAPPPLIVRLLSPLGCQLAENRWRISLIDEKEKDCGNSSGNEYDPIRPPPSKVLIYETTNKRSYDRLYTILVIGY
jgi:hypothetical protein